MWSNHSLKEMDIAYMESLNHSIQQVNDEAT